MSNHFEVRIGQRWHKKNDDGIPIYIDILDLYVADLIGDCDVVYKIRVDFGGEVTERTAFEKLHLDLRDKGWKLVSATESQPTMHTTYSKLTTND